MEIYKNLSLESLDGEIWKEIDGYSGDYFVSNFGRVKSFKNNCGIKEKILTPFKNSDGYLYFSLCKNGKKYKSIHVLMFETFNNYKLKNNECVHHIDFTKDNILDNLQLMTTEEHTSLHHKGKIVSEENKRKQSERMKGENHPRSILKEKDIVEIRKLSNEGILTQMEIGKTFNIDQTTISAIKNKKIWKHIKGDY